MNYISHAIFTCGLSDWLLIKFDEFVISLIREMKTMMSAKIVLLNEKFCNCNPPSRDNFSVILKDSIHPLRIIRPLVAGVLQAR